MHQHRQERRSDYHSSGTGADAAQDAIDHRIEQTGVGHHTEVEDREDEHRRHRRGLLQAGQDERPDLPAHPGQNGGDRRHGDQRDERRHAPAHDRGQQEPDGREAKDGQHASAPPLT
jgi:hypothetical protein